MHLMYDDDKSARMVGHKLSSYATAKCKSPEWFQNKESFMGFICKAFEEYWDELNKDGR